MTKIAINVGQHLPAVATRPLAASSWNGAVTRDVAAAVVPTSFKRTAQVLIPPASPPV